MTKEVPIMEYGLTWLSFESSPGRSVNSVHSVVNSDTWSLGLGTSLELGAWDLGFKRKRSALHDPSVPRSAFQHKPKDKTGGQTAAQKQNSKFLVAGDDEEKRKQNLRGGCLWAGGKTRKPGGPRRSPQRTHPCSLLSEFHESMAEKLPSAAWTSASHSALGRRVFQPARWVQRQLAHPHCHSFVESPVNCFTRSFTIAGRHRTSHEEERRRRQHPPGRSSSPCRLLPTAKF
jgi:hypothetical protein